MHFIVVLVCSIAFNYPKILVQKSFQQIFKKFIFSRMLCKLILILLLRNVGNFNVLKDLSDFAITVIIQSFHNRLSTIQDNFLIYIHL